jgi:hypothetical protein
LDLAAPRGLGLRGVVLSGLEVAPFGATELLDVSHALT